MVNPTLRERANERINQRRERASSNKDAIRVLICEKDTPYHLLFLSDTFLQVEGHYFFDRKPEINFIFSFFLIARCVYQISKSSFLLVR